MIRHTPTHRGSVAKGCLIALGIFVILIIGLGIWVAVSWKSWAASAAKFSASAMIQDTKLPQAQKDQITARINTFADDFKAGKINADQFTKVFDALQSGPLPAMIIATAIYEGDLAQNGNFTAEEKAAAQRTMQRVVRGVAEKSITTATLEAIIKPIDTRRQRGPGAAPHQTPSPEVLRKVLEDAKKAADDAKVPDEPYELNFAAEVDKVLNAASAPANTLPSPPPSPSK